MPNPKTIFSVIRQLESKIIIIVTQDVNEIGTGADVVTVARAKGDGGAGLFIGASQVSDHGGSRDLNKNN